MGGGGGEGEERDNGKGGVGEEGKGEVRQPGSPDTRAVYHTVYVTVPHTCAALIPTHVPHPSQALSAYLLGLL